ncbi:MAG: serine--tRNA ligase [Patescibacteria group bacterium]
MLDPKFIRENFAALKKDVSAKQLDPKVVDDFLKIDEKRKKLLGEVEELQRQRNLVAKARDIEKGKKIKKQLSAKEPDLAKVEEAWQSALRQIPNPPAKDVKVGKDGTANEVLRKWGEPAKFSFTPKDHLKIGQDLGIIDVERAAKVSGTRFAYLKGDAALLEFALVSFAMNTLVKEGFIPVVPPVLIKKEAMQGMGYLEHGGEEEMYVFDKDGLVLVGTSEQSVGPMHMNEVLAGKDLPLRYVGFSTCFRREAGAYGKDTKGILRVHQFDKVEMFSFTKPQDADKEHEFFLSLEEKLLQALKIPYQVVKMCSGDLGAPAARKYDLEAWLPGQNEYRELTSTSTTTDFQSRRLNIKYKEGDKSEFVHMLNGTAFAIGRTLIAILENYQQEDGTIKVPEVLLPYLGKKVIGKSEVS